MSRLEPRIVFVVAVVIGHFAEANERMHLVNFAIHGVLHLGGVMHIRVGGVFEQLWLP